jgi:hypothetical protein
LKVLHAVQRSKRFLIDTTLVGAIQSGISRVLEDA